MMVDLLNQEMLDFLNRCVNSGVNLICAGAEYSGKTTLLNGINKGVDIIDVNSDSGFRELYEMVYSGKRVFAEYHATDEIEAVFRFAIALMNDTVSENDAIRMVVSKFPIIVIICALADGTRRVVRISELVDVTENGHVSVNKLFEFKMNGEVKRNRSSGVVEEIFGNFQRVNDVSDRLKCHLKGGILSA